MSFAEKVLQTSTVPVHIIRCKDIHQRDCFYVLMCSTAKLALIMNSAEDIENMKETGHVLASGFGHEIPPDTKIMLKEKYGLETDSLK